MTFSDDTTAPLLPNHSSASYPPSPSPSPTPITSNIGGFIRDHHSLPPTLKRWSIKWFIIISITALFGILLVSTSLNEIGEDGNDRARIDIDIAKARMGGIKDWSGKKFEDVAGSIKGLINPNKQTESNNGAEEDTISDSNSSSTPKISDGFNTSGPTINISALPRPRLPDGDSETKYIGFLPHSGFHNQRSAFQNALMLGNLLNRTVLVPPIWIGWPTPTQFYEELQQTWTNNLLMNPKSFDLPDFDPTSDLFLPAKYHSTSEIIERTPSEISAAAHHASNLAKIQAENKLKWEAKGWEVRADGFPISDLKAEDCKSYSAECRHTYKDTFLAWDFLVDLDKLGDKVKVVDRWDMREKSLPTMLGVAEEDIYVFKDEQAYDFQFQEADTKLITPGSGHWHHSVSLPALSRLPQKVLLFGSLFGSGRIRITSVEGEELEELLTTSLAFRNPWLMEPAEAIRERLGGGKNYIGIHARVGDGVFLRHADENMEVAWRRVVRRLKLSSEDTEVVWKIVNQLKEKEKSRRSLNLVVEDDEISNWRGLDEGDYHLEVGIVELESEDEDSDTTIPKSHRHHHRGKKRAPVIPLPIAQNPSLKNLTCRPLYTTPRLLALNTPIYLATDSRSPLTDPHLAIFFKTFPCTFILSDFDRAGRRNDEIVVESVGFMGKLVNEKDGIGLGRLFLPFLEAMVAAMGDFTVGTAGSTFSTFAESGLHRAYREDS